VDVPNEDVSTRVYYKESGKIIPASPELNASEKCVKASASDHGHPEDARFHSPAKSSQARVGALEYQSPKFRELFGNITKKGQGVYKQRRIDGMDDRLGAPNQAGAMVMEEPLTLGGLLNAISASENRPASACSSSDLSSDSDDESIPSDSQESAYFSDSSSSEAAVEVLE